MRSSSTLPIVAIVAMVSIAAALVMRGVESSVRVYAVVYLAAEALASIVALALLRNMEIRHVRAIERAASEGGRIVQMFDSAIDAVDSAYATAANALAGAGLIGSATILLIGASQTHMDALLLIAPKAFAATGFALCCSTVVSIRAQWPFLSSMRSWRDDVIQRQRLDTGGGAPDAASLVREDLITDSIIQFTVAFREMNARNQKLTDMLERQGQQSKENNVAAGTLLERAIGVISPAAISLEALTARMRPEVLDAIPALHNDVQLLLAMIERDAVAVGHLAQMLGSEREGVMQAQADVLREQTVALAREALGQLTIASGGVIRTHLDEIAKRVEQHAETVYDRAYAHATEQLSRTLNQTSSSTRALADSLAEAAEKLVSVQLEIHGVVTALDTGAERTVESAARFRQIAEDIKRTLDAFATPQLEGGDKPTLIGEIETLTKQIHQTASVVNDQWREVQAERKKLAGFRTRLVEIAQKQRTEDVNG